MESSDTCSYNFDHDDDGFVAIANELLIKFRLTPIQDLSQCTAAVLVALYEGILGNRLPGIISDPVTKEDEIHNMQLVIDSLEHDVLHIDLSHITGKALVEGHLTTLRYLLEILAGLMEYVMEQIENDGSTDLDGNFADDPTMLSSGTISGISHILQADLSSQSSHGRPSRRSHHSRAPASATRPGDDSESESTSELIKLGESAASAYGYGSVEMVPGNEYGANGHGTGIQIMNVYEGNEDHLSVASSNIHRISASWKTADEDKIHGKAVNAAADSTEDLIREGASLARRYASEYRPANDGRPTKEDIHQEPERDLPAGTETHVSSQNTSTSTDSSASWPKHPQVSSTKPPSEFDTLGLGLRSRSSIANKGTTVDSLVRGLDGETDDVTRSQQHVHTHHHYHQPVAIARVPEPMYTTSFPHQLPPSNSSGDITEGNLRAPAPSRTATSVRPPISNDNGSYTDKGKPFKSGAFCDNVPFPDRDRPMISAGIHDNVPFTDRGRPFTSGDVHDNVPLTDRGRPLTTGDVHDNEPFSDRGRQLISGDVCDNVSFTDRGRQLTSGDVHDNVPFTNRGRQLTSGDIRDNYVPITKRSRQLTSGDVHDNVPFTDSGRQLTSGDVRENAPFTDRGRQLTSGDVRDNIPFTDRGRPLTSGDVRDNISFTDRGRQLTSGDVCDNVLFNGKGRPLISGNVCDNVPFTNRSKSVTSEAIRDAVPFSVADKHPSYLHVPSVSAAKHQSQSGFAERDVLKSSRHVTNIYSKSAPAAATNFNVVREQSQRDVSSYQKRVTSRQNRDTPADLQGQLSSDHRITGSAPKDDHPFSLASERYKTYLATRLKESGLTRETDQATHKPSRLAERKTNSFPPYDTVEKYLPARPKMSSKPTTKHIVGNHTAQDSSRSRQSNLTVEGQMEDQGSRYSSFKRGLDVAERPGRRIEAMEKPVPRITKEIMPSETDSDLDESTMHSDTEIDYSPVSSNERKHKRKEHSYNLRSKGKRPLSKRPVAKQQSVLIQPPAKPNLKVRFEDALDADAKGEMGKIRKKLNEEKKTQERQKQVLQTVYVSNLKEVKQSLKQQAAKRKQTADQEDAEYKQVYGRPCTSSYQPAKKYSAKVPEFSSVARRGRPVGRKVSGKRKRSASSSPTVKMRRRPLHIGDDELLPTVMHEFPFLHVSPQTAHSMWRKQRRQMEHLTKTGMELPNKNKTQLKVEDAERRQETLLHIMKKELAHNQRMRDIKERNAAESAMTSKAREQRQVTARARRYYDEFRLRAKSRMMKRRNREEQIFKKLFEDGLDIQKARIRDMRKYARDKREQISARQQDEIDSLENYYRDQFTMLAQTIAKERHELQVKDNAQTKVMEQMKREMRRKMEREIRDFQEQLYRDEDTEYFRQIEADRMQRQLQMAHYKT